MVPALVLAMAGFMCSKKGIYEPCLQESLRGLPGKASPALAAGAGSGHPVRLGSRKARLGAEWIAMGFVTAALMICGTAITYLNVDPEIERPVETPSSIVVMSYNVHQGFNNAGRADPTPMLEAIRDREPDIVLLQETQSILPSGGCYDLPGYLAGMLDMDIARGPPPWEGTYGLSILSKFPLIDAKVVMLTSSVEQKYYLSCQADMGTFVLNLVCVHLGQDEADRPIQTYELASALHNMTAPLVVGGDFNAEPDDPLMARFNHTSFGGIAGNESNDLGLISGWHSAAHREPEDISTFTWPASHLEDDEVHIDYVLMTPGLNPLNAWIDTRDDASDHRPVTVEIGQSGAHPPAQIDDLPRRTEIVGHRLQEGRGLGEPPGIEEVESPKEA